MPFARRCDPGGAQPEVEGAGKAMEDEGAGVGRLAREIVAVTFSSRFDDGKMNAAADERRRRRPQAAAGRRLARDIVAKWTLPRTEPR